MPFLETILQRIARLCVHRYRTVLGVVAALSLGALAALPALRFDASVMQLIPKDAPTSRSFRTFERSFGDSSLLSAVVWRAPSVDRDTAERFLELLAGEMDRSPLIQWVHYRLPSLTDSSYGPFLNTALLRLDATRLARLTYLLSDRGIERQIQENKQSLRFPYYLTMKRWVRDDPLNMRSVLLDQIRRYVGSYRFNFARGYLASPRDTAYVLFAQPAGLSEDLQFCAALTRGLSGMEARVRAIMTAEDGTPPPGPHDLSVSYTGHHIFSANTARAIPRDLLLTALLTALGALLLFYYTFRHHRFLFQMALLLILSLLWTGAAALPLVQVINFITCAAAAILTGLAVDYGVHLCSRFQEEWTRHPDLETAVTRALTGAGPGIVVGSFTTAASFLSLTLLPNEGLVQLGLVVGTGILLSMLLAIVFLPSLWCWSFNRKPILPLTGAPRSLQLERLAMLSARHPRTGLGIGLLLTLLLGTQVTRLAFTGNVRHLLPKQNEGLELAYALTDAFGGSFYINNTVLIEANDLDTALGIQDRVNRALDGLMADDALASYESIRTLLPPEDHQQYVLAALASGRSNHFSTSRIRNTFYARLADYQFQPLASYDHYLDRLSHILSITQPLTVAQLQTGPMSAQLNRFLHTEDGPVRLATYVWPRQNLEDMDEVNAFNRRLQTVIADQTDGAQVTGSLAVLSDIGQLGGTDLLRVALFSLMIVLAISLLRFRNLRFCLLALAPISMGWIWMLGTMHLLGIDHALSIICAGTLIIGIGIDDGLHMLVRYQETGDLEDTITGTGRALVLTSLTSGIAFGSLMLANQTTLSMIGLPVVLGIGFCLLSTLLVIPAALRLGDHHKRFLTTPYTPPMEDLP